MPQKLNKAGKMQDYIPKGNGDPSGEYGTSKGTNKNFTASDKKSKANVITENKSVVVENGKTKKERIRKEANEKIQELHKISDRIIDKPTKEDKELFDKKMDEYEKWEKENSEKTIDYREYFKDKIISIIEENELVTSAALIDLNEKLDLKLDKSDLLIEKGEGENSVQLKNTENKANGWGSIALFGYGNTAGASNTFVGGDTNYAYGTGSVVIGGKNNTIEETGEFSAIVGGDENLVSGDRAFAFGHNVKVYSQYGAAFGYDNTVIGLSGFAEGTRNTVSAHGAHAEGAGTTASGEFSHSEGFETIASGAHAHSEGYQTQALQVDAHTEGHLSIANEHAAHAEGWQTYAGGWSTHAEGIETITSNHNGEHAQGKYNISNPGTIHSIGVGSDSSNRKNAVEVKDDGKHYILGIGGYDGTNIDTATDVASALNQLNEITYSNLYNKVQNSQLVPGAKYRITDYETIVETSVYWQSANHPFDIIVTAISENRLDEKATCCLSDRDTSGYFANCGIESWKIKYTIYNDSSYAWAASNGKGVIYWMEDNNRNFCPFDFKNIRINPNGGSGATPQDALAKAAEQGVTTDDIASRYMLSSDGFYYAFSSFDGTVDRSLDRHYIQDSGLGILGKSDEVQYLSGTVIICPENTEIHHVTVNYGYWSAIIVTGCLAGDTAKTVVRNLNINYMSKSYIIVGQATDTFINSIASSYVYIGFTFGQPNFIGYMNNSYIYVVYRATSNVIKYAHGVAISCQRFESNDLEILQYVSYPGIFDKNNYNVSTLSDGTKVTKINYLTCKQALITGSETSYLNIRDLVTAGLLKENTGYRQILYFDNGGILKSYPEFQIYNINTSNTYIADGDADNDKKISINDSIINVALSNHNHSIFADTKDKNLVLAGPSSGNAAVPTFRSLTVSDLPTGTTATTVALGNHEHSNYITTSYLKDTTKNSIVGSKGGGSKLYSVELDNNGDMCVALTDESKIWENSELKTDLDNQNNITAGFNNSNVIDGNSTESKKSLHMPSSEFGSMNAVGSFMQFGSGLWKCQLVAGSRGYDYIRTNNNKKTPEGLYFRKYGEISKGVDGYGWTPWREIVSIDNNGKLCITHLDSEYHYSGGPTSVNNTLTIPYTTNFSNSIKVNNTNVSLEGHTHTIEINDNTDTLENILTSLNTAIDDNRKLINANADAIKGKANNHDHPYFKTSETYTKNYVLASPSDKTGAAVFRKLVASDIPDLSANKITSDQLNVDRIPDLSANKITSDELNVDRIPNLPATKLPDACGRFDISSAIPYTCEDGLLYSEYLTESTPAAGIINTSTQSFEGLKCFCDGIQICSDTINCYDTYCINSSASFNENTKYPGGILFGPKNNGVVLTYDMCGTEPHLRAYDTYNDSYSIIMTSDNVNGYVTKSTSVSISNKNTTKAYLVGSTSTSSTSATLITDSGVYLTTTSGCLQATKMYASSGFFQESDERLKDFENDIQIDLDKLKELPKKYFTWKNDTDKKLNIGTSAQELQKLYPEIVSENDEGNLIVEYDKLAIIALAGIDKLQDKYDKKIQELEDKLNKVLELIK